MFTRALWQTSPDSATSLDGKCGSRRNNHESAGWATRHLWAGSRTLGRTLGCNLPLCRAEPNAQMCLFPSLCFPCLLNLFISSLLLRCLSLPVSTRGAWICPLSSSVPPLQVSLCPGPQENIDRSFAALLEFLVRSWLCSFQVPVCDSSKMP